MGLDPGAAPVSYATVCDRLVFDAEHSSSIAGAWRAARENARRTCRDPNGTTGYPVLVMQWDGADLNQLPATLLQQMPTARQHTAAVGACPSTHQQEGFTTYHVAVLMY